MEDQNQEEQMCQIGDHTEALLKSDVFTLTVNQLVDVRLYSGETHVPGLRCQLVRSWRKFGNWRNVGILLAVFGVSTVVVTGDFTNDSNKSFWIGL